MKNAQFSNHSDDILSIVNWNNNHVRHNSAHKVETTDVYRRLCRNRLAIFKCKGKFTRLMKAAQFQNPVLSLMRNQLKPDYKALGNFNLRGNAECCVFYCYAKCRGAQAQTSLLHYDAFSPVKPMKMLLKVITFWLKTKQ